MKFKINNEKVYIHRQTNNSLQVHMCLVEILFQDQKDYLKNNHFWGKVDKGHLRVS
jgi:acid phosphatase class B